MLLGGSPGPIRDILRVPPLYLNRNRPSVLEQLNGGTATRVADAADAADADFIVPQPPEKERAAGGSEASKSS